MPKHFANRSDAQLLTELTTECITLRRKQCAMGKSFRPSEANALRKHYLTIDRLMVELAGRDDAFAPLLPAVVSWRKALTARLEKQHNAAEKLAASERVLDPLLAL